jgi:hypothetical protein
MQSVSSTWGTSTTANVAVSALQLHGHLRPSIKTSDWCIAAAGSSMRNFHLPSSETLLEAGANSKFVKSELFFCSLLQSDHSFRRVRLQYLARLRNSRMGGALSNRLPPHYRQCVSASRCCTSGMPCTWKRERYSCFLVRCSMFHLRPHHKKSKVRIQFFSTESIHKHSASRTSDGRGGSEDGVLSEAPSGRRHNGS